MKKVADTVPAGPKVLEFFAGIGLARLGLEAAGFDVAWSNDFEPAKKAMYEGHFGTSEGHVFELGDVGAVSAVTLPQDAKVAWASSPCTDLSLAGSRAGLRGKASGTFWKFIDVLGDLGERGALPPIAVLENVTGLATSHGGDDLTAAIQAFNELGYSVDVLAIDARRFVPQSRPRLFLIACIEPPAPSVAVSDARPSWLQWVFSDPTLKTHQADLPSLPLPLMDGLGGLVEDVPEGDGRWWDSSRVLAFRDSLSPVQRDRVSVFGEQGHVVYRSAYRRTRQGVARWEIRPDDISGCLRTARGGSSKQAVVRFEGPSMQVRWMTPLEYARLMGAADFSLDGVRNNQALFGFGDAVAVPAVTWLANNYLKPILATSVDWAD
ncbi:DNA (cytosine-5)-methyltransferase 1 [Frigoribacterium sp. PvP120]|uniref:DNA cytosine methyltransferase n=1 Tax=unclassified Frigoribacterium TaxID=2627005 RepID=UPI001AE9F238|nr:DNA cytosine methyltransferase [Frigoribacterium sp. PvP121]MBP1242145.1 DNA (cytosine-5)-methyltransferase 1 [Frigoribacterium sp. PvP121]